MNRPSFFGDRSPAPFGRRDAGATLVELVVAILLIGALATMVTANVMRSSHATTELKDQVWHQSSLNDAMTRITRDVAASNPILFTKTSNGWPSNTPSRSDLWVQFDTGTGSANTCVRTRYYVSGTSTHSLLSDSYLFPDATCPDPRKWLTPSELTANGVTKTTTTLVGTLQETGAKDSAGRPAVFDYFTRDNTSLLATGSDFLVSQTQVDGIARVKVNVASATTALTNGLLLSTSVAPRSITDPNMSSIPLPDCTQANLRLSTDGNDPAAPVITWNKTDNADYFTLGRTVTGPNKAYTNGLNPTPLSNDTVARTTTRSFTDSALRGYWGINLGYHLTISGPGGVVTCSIGEGTSSTAGTLVMPTPNMGTPTLSATVTTGSRTPSDATISGTNVALSWSTPSNTTSFTLYSMAASPTTGEPTGSAQGSSTASTSSSDVVSLHAAKAWYVVANSSVYTPTISSSPSNTQKVMGHADRPSVTSSIGADGTYTVNWTPPAGSNADGWAIFYTTNNGSSWVKETTVAGSSRTYSSKMCTNSYNRCKYAVGAANTGPRGSTASSAQWVGNSAVASTDAHKYQRYYRQYQYGEFEPYFYNQQFRWASLTTGGCWVPPGSDINTDWADGTKNGLSGARWVPHGINGKITASGKHNCNGDTAEYGTTTSYTPWGQRSTCAGDGSKDGAEHNCWIGGQDKRYDPNNWGGVDWDIDPGTVASYDWGGGNYWTTHIPTGGYGGGGYYTAAPARDDWVGSNHSNWNGTHASSAYDQYKTYTNTAQAVYQWGTSTPAAFESGGVYYLWDDLTS